MTLIFVCVKKGTQLPRANFVHGVDGLGNQNFPAPEGKPIKESAAEFLVQQANLYPGEITVVALGPLTNIALVITFIFRVGILARHLMVILLTTFVVFDTGCTIGSIIYKKHRTNCSSWWCFCS